MPLNTFATHTHTQTHMCNGKGDTIRSDSVPHGNVNAIELTSVYSSFLSSSLNLFS